MDRKNRQIRAKGVDFKTRVDEAGKKFIEGYFAVFNSIYEMWPGATEDIAPGAFDETINDDIRCLVNHDTTLVMGRTTANTFNLKIDEKGIWGEVEVNEADQDALNLYARVNRRDVTQCSIGFDILEEERKENIENNTVHWRIVKLKLYECSIVTFPAYEDTGVTARKTEYEEIQKRKLQERKNALLFKLKGDENNGS